MKTVRSSAILWKTDVPQGASGTERVRDQVSRGGGFNKKRNQCSDYSRVLIRLENPAEAYLYKERKERGGTFTATRGGIWRLERKGAYKKIKSCRAEQKELFVI